MANSEAVVSLRETAQPSARLRMALSGLTSSNEKGAAVFEAPYCCAEAKG